MLRFQASFTILITTKTAKKRMAAVMVNDTRIFTGAVYEY